MQFVKSSLLALSVCAALAAPASAAGLWKPGLQQKTCASIAWRANTQTAGTGSRVLNVWNTDGSVLQLEKVTIYVPGSPGAVAAAQALMVAACSPRALLPDGHKYWVNVDNPNLAAPHPSQIVVTYPPTDTPPVFKTPPKGLWTAGLQQKTCAAIEWRLSPGTYWQDPYDSDLHVHNTDGSALIVYGVVLQASSYHQTGPFAAAPEQLAIIDACGPNASVSANRNYRAAVDQPNNLEPAATQLLLQLPQQ